MPSRPDADVTEDDLRRFNLVLLGRPDQNGLVARILPETIAGRADLTVERQGGASLASAIDATDRHRGEVEFQPLVPVALLLRGKDELALTLDARALLVHVEVAGCVACRAELLPRRVAANGAFR